MRFLACVALTSLLLLGGCANTAFPDLLHPSSAAGSEAAPSPDPTGTAGAAPASAPAVHVPEFPKGELSPIASTPTTPRPVKALTAPADIWERIRRGFGMPDLDSDLVPDRVQWYAARPDDLQDMAERSRKYLFYIVEEIERRGMPTELALLPFIESAYNPHAYSRARAAGMWQFIPSTGRLYQLKQNAFRDDRRDVLASTQAALDYLEKLYGMFGDWHLALAAYNWGEGSVSRAIAKNQRKKLGTRYLDLSMPMETRFYVPKLQAIKNIVADPAAYGVKLPAIDNHPYFDTVTITRDMDVAVAAKLAEVPLEDFKALNPSLHRPVILAAGSPQILLPWDNAAIFQRNLDAAAGTQLSSWTVWIAPSTMKTAEAARRVKMSEDDLRYVNHIPPHMIIRAGSSLLVPRPARQERDVATRIANNGQLALTPELALRRIVLKAGKHDSVATVARRYRLSPEKVAEWNKVGTNARFAYRQNIIIYRMLPVRSAPHHSRARPRPTSRVAAKGTQVAGR